MKRRSSARPIGRVTTVACALMAAVSAACRERAPGSLVEPTSDEAPAVAPSVRLLVSSMAPSAGDSVVVALEVSEDELLVGGVQGRLHWDPAGLDFVGIIPQGRDLVVLNEVERDEGRPRFVAVNPDGLSSEPIVFALRVVQPEAVRGIRVEVHHVVDLDMAQHSVHVPRLEADPFLPNAASARTMDDGAWAERLTLPVTELGGSAAAPGASAVWGDPTQDGVVNVLDNLYAANLSVGNTGVSECIIGTDLTMRDCVAANVFPTNLPGLGDAGDPCPPGVDDCSDLRQRTVNVLDNLLIALESVGSDQDVVGEPIPRVASRSDTVAISGSVTGVRILNTDSVYLLQGVVTVGDGGIAGRLEVGAGVSVVADFASSLVVRRGSSILAEGTQLDPVVFECRGPQVQGCWSGITVRGFGPLNFGSFSSPDGGCRQAPAGADATGGYGGCDPMDSSGTLRFVRVHNALRGLRLEGVGSGTTIDFVQVDRSLGHGLEITGGSVDVRHIYLTGNRAHALHWRGGWQGRGQYVLAVQDPTAYDGGLLGTAAPGDPLVAPGLTPKLFNVTVTGGAFRGIASAVGLEDGVGGEIANVLLFRPEIGLSLAGQETCDRLSAGGLSLGHWLVAGAGSVGDPDADPADCGAFSSPNVEGQVILDPASRSVVLTDSALVANLLRSPGLSLGDLRPAFGSAADTAAAASLPADGFFQGGATFLGAVDPSINTTGNIPWYTGWAANFSPLVLPPTVASPDVAAGDRHACALAANGVGWCWGGNDFGQVGDGTELRRPTPVAVQGGPFVGLVGGASHTCALDDVGLAHCWGRNDLGEVGDGSIQERSVPTAVDGGITFESLAAGGAGLHTCGLDGSGAAYCWGYNGFGQLGDGTTGDDGLCSGFLGTPVGCRTRPVRVSGGLGVFSSLATGRHHTCGLSATGLAYCWGKASDGQVGDATTGSSSACPDGTGGCRLTPTAVSGGLAFDEIASGNLHTCALDTVGKAHCWGDNSSGQLGNGTTMSSTVPVSVGGGALFERIWAAAGHTCALDAGGTAYCWGDNLFGQIGDGSAFNTRLTPTAVVGGLSFSRLTLGPSHTCGLTVSGEAYCWGTNFDSQLGDGSAAQRLMPTRVASGGIAF